MKVAFFVILGRPKLWFLLFANDVESTTCITFLDLLVDGNSSHLQVIGRPLRNRVNLAIDDTDFCQQIKECTIKKLKNKDLMI